MTAYPPVDQHSAIAAANANANDQDSSLFSSAMGFISNMNKNDKDDVDEDEVLRKHDQAYNQGNAGGMSANSIGTYDRRIVIIGSQGCFADLNQGCRYAGYEDVHPGIRQQPRGADWR